MEVVHPCDALHVHIEATWSNSESTCATCGDLNQTSRKVSLSRLGETLLLCQRAKGLFRCNMTVGSVTNNSVGTCAIKSNWLAMDNFSFVLMYTHCLYSVK